MANNRNRIIIPHNKVRTGCETCKKRRVKCDETRPTCSRCATARRKCVYHQSLPSYPIFSPTSHIDQNAVRFGIRDLELLHHWTTVTAATVGGTEDLRVMLRDTLPTEGFAKPYLLHLILAVSSLHLAYLRPDEHSVYSTLAAHHYSTALPMFRANLQVLDETNCHALYGSSQLLAKYALARERHPQHLLFSPTLDRSIQTNWLLLVKGAYLIRDQNCHLLCQGPMASTATDCWNAVPESARSHFELKLGKVTHLLRASVTDRAKLDVYLEVLQILCHLFALEADLHRTVTTKAIFTAALARIPSEFFAFLAQRRPEAILLLAHFCIILEKMNDDSVWYMRNWSRMLFNECIKSLGDCWASYLAWPLASLGDTQCRSQAPDNVNQTTA